MIGKVRQADFCAEAGIDPSYLSHIENNKKRPAFDFLEEKIARQIGLPVGVILFFSIEESDVTEPQWQKIQEIRAVLETEFLSKS